ncbi:MAG: SRPBCC family protein [Myxococcales bacterium]|nr:SRPBCC family protein [Myxococcales bacterium]
MPEPIRMSYRLETRADQARTWRAMSDTDAFNRLAKANFTYETEYDEAGRPRPVGTVKKLGLAIRFHEEPFAFRAPHWFRIRRVFEGGPARSITATAQLATTETGGTSIDYALEVEPRTALFRPILSFDLKRTTERWVGEALGAVVAALEDQSQDDAERLLLGPPPALSAKQAARLEELGSRLPPGPLVSRLVSLIRAAPERDQATMSPLALSQAWACPLEDLVAFLIQAARVGVLGARIDILCPSCLVPRAELGPNGPPPGVHCDTCAIPLDATFPESLAVHFFPSPEVRALRVKLECLGSPSRTPQIVAQETLAPGAEADLTIPLEPATYQLRTLPQIGPPALLVVGDGEQGSEVAFDVGASIQPQLVHLRPEPRLLAVRNLSGGSFTVVLERLVPPRKVLTLGRLLAEFPDLADVVPTRGFVSTMACFQAYALALRLPDETSAVAAARALSGARVAYPSGPVVLALYAELEPLFDDLAKIDLSRALVGFAAGAAFENVIGGKSIPMGPSVDAAYDALGASYPGFIAAQRASLERPEIIAAASRARWLTRTAVYGGPAIGWLVRAA